MSSSHRSGWALAVDIDQPNLDQSDEVPGPCLFCDITQHKLLCQGGAWYVRFDNFPANPGHVELVTCRHVESVFDLNDAEAAEVFGLFRRTRDLLVAEYTTDPDGWTIGVNEGKAAGRSVPHVHIHLIPRHHGDMPDPRGGIRQAAPNCDPAAWILDQPAKQMP